MRPVKKWSIGHEYTDNQQANHTISKLYKPYGNACVHLQHNIGTYCSYCEVRHSDLQVEHVVCQDQMKKGLKNPSAYTPYDWDNFVLACARCNGNSTIKDASGNTIGSCKGNKIVGLQRIGRSLRSSGSGSTKGASAY